MVPLPSWEILRGLLRSLMFQIPKNKATLFIQTSKVSSDTSLVRLYNYSIIWKVQCCRRCTFSTTRRCHSFPAEKLWAFGTSSLKNVCTPEPYLGDIFQATRTCETGLELQGRRRGSRSVRRSSRIPPQRQVLFVLLWQTSGTPEKLLFEYFTRRSFSFYCR